VRKIGRQTKEFEPLLKLPDTIDHTLMQEFAVCIYHFKNPQLFQLKSYQLK